MKDNALASVQASILCGEKVFLLDKIITIIYLGSEERQEYEASKDRLVGQRLIERAGCQRQVGLQRLEEDVLKDLVRQTLECRQYWPGSTLLLLGFALDLGFLMELLGFLSNDTAWSSEVLAVLQRTSWLARAAHSIVDTLAIAVTLALAGKKHQDEQNAATSSRV